VRSRARNVPAGRRKVERKLLFLDVNVHGPNISYRPDRDLSGAAEDAELLFAVGYRVANADKFPEWKPGNEFRAKWAAMLKRQ